ncbi:MAG: hypothetical protein HQ530_00335 [Parcubacteria group bacterium]|nr:hypothetical protein [Parcubacteria group bacterium]
MSQSISLEKNWVLFDTCSISKISVIGDATKILSAVQSRIGSFTPAITSLIRFEYLRQSKSKDEFEGFRDYLNDTYTEIDLYSKEDLFDIYNLSSELACVCRFVSSNHYKHISMVDFVHGGLLRRYPRNLFLLTFDINDFLTPIFKLVHHESIEVNGKLEIWALYSFDQNEFHKYIDIFKNK